MLRGSEKVTVTNYKESEFEGRTELVESGTTQLWARLETLNTTDAAALATSGLTGALTTRRLFCPEFPGDARSTVTDSAGCTYSVVGEPVVLRRGARTRHTEVLLSQHKPEAVYG